MTPRINPSLATLVIVVSFAALAMIPPTQDNAREGRVLVFVNLQDVGPGETHQRPFSITDYYQSMALSYNITSAAHVRAAVIGPDGARHDATANPALNELTLTIEEPATGAWQFQVSTLDTATERGFIRAGNFTMLGFGGTLRLA